MNLRFPLSAKILLWFFLNLLLLGLAFYVFFDVQFRMGLDPLLMGQAGDRIDALSNVIFDELRAASVEEHTEILEYFGLDYGVQIMLVRPDGGLIAGKGPQLAPEARSRLASFGAAVLRAQPPPRREEVSPPPQPPLADARRTHPKFMVHSSDPAGYWVGIRLPPFDHGRAGLQHVLLLYSPTLSGGGLFIDFKPWLLIGFGAVVFGVFKFPKVALHFVYPSSASNFLNM